MSGQRHYDMRKIGDLYEYPEKPWAREIIVETPLGDEIHIPCFYCGEPYQEEDHVLPVSFVARLDSIESLTQSHINLMVVVPACSECNRLLGNQLDETLSLRKSRVKQALRHKHRRLLDRPSWSEEELEELGPTLRSHVLASSEAANRLAKRLKW